MALSLLTVALLVIGWSQFAGVSREQTAQTRRLLLRQLAGDTLMDFYPLATVVSPTGLPLQSWRVDHVRRVTQAPREFLPPDNVPWQTLDTQKYHRYAELAGVVGLSERGERPYARALAVVGRETGFGISPPARVRDLPPHLIALVENPGLPIPWAEPREFDIDHLDSQVASPFRRDDWPDFYVIFSDGSLWRLKNDTPLDRLLPLMRISTARTSDREALLGDYVLEKIEP